MVYCDLLCILEELHMIYHAMQQKRKSLNVFLVPLKLGLSPSFKKWCLIVPQLLKYIVHDLCMALKGTKNGD